MGEKWKANVVKNSVITLHSDGGSRDLVCGSRGKIYKCRITLLCAETKEILYADDTSIMIIKKESIDVYTTQ